MTNFDREISFGQNRRGVIVEEFALSVYFNANNGVKKTQLVSLPVLCNFDVVKPPTSTEHVEPPMSLFVKAITKKGVSSLLFKLGWDMHAFRTRHRFCISLSLSLSPSFLPLTVQKGWCCCLGDQPLSSLPYTLLLLTTIWIISPVCNDLPSVHVYWRFSECLSSPLCFRCRYGHVKT